MPASPTRARIARLHRWLALALSPVIVVILLSGIVLAFRPIVGQRDGDAAPARPLDVTRALALVDSLDPRGTSRFAGFDRAHGVLGIGDGRGVFTFHDIASGRVVPPPPDAQPRHDVFDVAERIHRGGWLAGDALVSLGTLALIVLVIAGPFLARPTRGRSALSWHIRAGWFLWPLVALLPLSLVMTKLRLPQFPPRNAQPMSFASAIAIASRSGHPSPDVTRLDAIQRIPGGVFMVADGASGPEAWFVTASGARPMDTALSRAGRALHEGTWAGAWSGLLNVLAGLVTLVMLGTGITSWLKRRKPVSAARLAKAA